MGAAVAGRKVLLWRVIGYNNQILQIYLPKIPENPLKFL